MIFFDRSMISRSRSVRAWRLCVTICNVIEEKPQLLEALHAPKKEQIVWTFCQIFQICLTSTNAWKKFGTDKEIIYAKPSVSVSRVSEYASPGLNLPCGEYPQVANTFRSENALKRASVVDTILIRFLGAIEPSGYTRRMNFFTSPKKNSIGLKKRQ